MSDPIRKAFDRTPQCPALEAIIAPSLDAATKRHVAECAHCRAELAMFQQFESAEARPDEAADLAWIEADLARRSPAAAAVHESFGDRVRAWIESLLSPAGHGRLGLAAAALLVLVAAGIALRPGAGLRTGITNEPEVLRSAQFAAQAPIGDLDRAPTQFRWDAVPGAVSYHVRLVEVDGTQVWTADTASTSLDLPGDIAAKMSPGRAFHWGVAARDAGGRQMAATDLQTFHIVATPH